MKFEIYVVVVDVTLMVLKGGKSYSFHHVKKKAKPSQAKAGVEGGGGRVHCCWFQ